MAVITRLLRFTTENLSMVRKLESGQAKSTLSFSWRLAPGCGSRAIQVSHGPSHLGKLVLWAESQNGNDETRVLARMSPSRESNFAG